ncbi:MAG: hypothetical protein NTZ19_13305 [Bacteroidetes bacterium]|nr:hypothetical protein [Bacteroidota bacterium]
MFKVLIACYTNWDTSSEMPFVLKKSGVDIVDIYSGPKSWLISNSYFDKWIEAGKDKKSYTDNLKTLVRNGDYQWVIMADDELIKIMNEEDLDEDLFKKLMPINKIEHRYMLSSKVGFSKFCESAGILTPKYITYNSPEDLELIKSTLSFPIVNKRDFSSSGTDMFVSETLEELEKDLHMIPNNQNVLVQEYIDGTEIHVEGLFYDGVLVSYTNAHIVQTFSTKFSFTTRKSYFKDINLSPLLIDLGKKLGLNSFFNGVKRIISGDYKNGYVETPIKKTEVEVALFFKDMRRCFWKKDIKGLLHWVFNIHGYWRFLPFYDLKLSKRIITSVWNEIFAPKFKKLFGKS